MSDVFFEQSDFVQKRSTIKENVEWLIQKFPFVKNDYRKLLQMYWWHIDGLKRFIPFEELQKMTQPESITRAFREISNIRKKSFTQPIPIVQEARQIEEQNYHTYYSRKRRENEM